jgi:hypothetical protein
MLPPWAVEWEMAFRVGKFYGMQLTHGSACGKYNAAILADRRPSTTAGKKPLSLPQMQQVCCFVLLLCCCCAVVVLLLCCCCVVVVLSVSVSASVSLCICELRVVCVDLSLYLCPCVTPYWSALHMSVHLSLYSQPACGARLDCPPRPCSLSCRLQLHTQTHAHMHISSVFRLTAFLIESNSNGCFLFFPRILKPVTGLTLSLWLQAFGVSGYESVLCGPDEAAKFLEPPLLTLRKIQARQDEQMVMLSMQSGWRSLHESNPRLAVKNFRDVLSMVAGSLEAHVGLALAYRMLGHTELEVEHLRRAGPEAVLRWTPPDTRGRPLRNQPDVDTAAQVLHAAATEALQADAEAFKAQQAKLAAEKLDKEKANADALKAQQDKLAAEKLDKEKEKMAIHANAEAFKAQQDKLAAEKLENVEANGETLKAQQDKLTADKKDKAARMLGVAGSPALQHQQAVSMRTEGVASMTLQQEQAASVRTDAVDSTALQQQQAASKRTDGVDSTALQQTPAGLSDGLDEARPYQGDSKRVDAVEPGPALQQQEPVKMPDSEQLQELQKQQPGLLLTERSDGNQQPPQSVLQEKRSLHQQQSDSLLEEG